MKMSFILMKTKLISVRKVFHLASFCKWEFLELRNGALAYDIIRFSKILKTGKQQLLLS